MKQLFSIILVFGLLLGCSKKPNYSVSQEKMVDVLTDLTIASSIRSVTSKRDSVQYLVTYQSILKKHGLDSLKFIEAQNSYQKSPELYEVIYDSVQKRLQKKLDETRALPPEKGEDDEIKVIKIKDIPFARGIE